jgi:serine/threonine protein kinase/tetratricopeptide (TPR) repeat protein
MDTSRRDHIRALLAEAQSVPPEERADFLRDRCDDSALWEEVASLLAAQEEASGFYEALADSVVAPMLRELGEMDADGPPPQESDPLGLEGEVVGRYAIEEHLGGGGMGIVYRARDTDLGRTVALKFLPPHLAGTEEAEERFSREARAAAALEHSNVGTIHEIGRTSEGRRYIVMTYYEGETLKKTLEREGPLPIEKVLDYATQIAEGLARAHEAGIVHRDVKPANVMITEQDEVKLVDFGLARLAESPRLTASGQQLGTVGYMSPEQVEGGTVGPATDLWALGVVLYEMLTGERPFQGKRRAAVLHAVVNDTPTPAGEHRPEIPPELAQVVERCLQKSPAERYESAALAEDLRALRAGDSPAVSGPSSAQSSNGNLEQSRWIVAAAAALLAVGLAALGWSVWSGDEPPAPTNRSVAVLPFEVSGSGAQEWRDGMVTALSVNLDGTAGLRAIPPRTVLAQTEGEAALEQGEALGVARRIGARYALLGSAVALGNELRLTATAYEAGSGRRLGRARVRGAPDSVMALADDLTRRVLGVLLKKSEAEIPSIDLASRTTASLPALKAYLDGERHYRSGRYAEALNDFETAVARDSTFALAYVRLAWARAWRSKNQAASRAWKRAYDLSDRLPRRERRITRANNLWWNRRHVRAAADTVRRLTEAYPDDPRIWALLGEVIFHTTVPRGWPEAEAAFQRAVALDPDVAAYHHHLVEMAMSLHRDRRLTIERLRAHPGGGEVKPFYRLAIDLVFGTAEERQAALRGLDTLDMSTIREHRFALQHPADAAVLDSVLRRLDRRAPGSGLFAMMRTAHYFERGRIDEALVQMKRDPPLAGVLLSGMNSVGVPLPDSVLRTHLEPARIGENASPRLLQSAGLYLVNQNRADELPTVLNRLQDAAGTATRFDRDGIPESEIERMVDEVQGYRAFRAGDLERAQRLWAGQSHWTPGALWRGDLYRQLGRLTTAEGWYWAAWPFPLADERLGRLYEEMGKPEKAVAAYERFIDAWEDADPGLQNRVERVRKRVRALSKQSRTE